MPPATQKQRRPTCELSFHYTVATLLAQQLELKLRAVVHTARYWSPHKGLNLASRHLKCLKQEEGFIGDAACAALLRELRTSGAVRPKDPSTWEKFSRACKHRHLLAHRFLAEHDFHLMTRHQERDAIRRLTQMAGDLSLALQICRQVLSRAEAAGAPAYSHWSSEIGVHPARTRGLPQVTNN